MRDCGFASLPELRPEPVEQWLGLQAAEGTRAATRNASRGALVAFANWCVKTDATDRERPLLERMAISRGKRKGERTAKLSEGTRDKLARIGRERELVYKTFVLTGLRRVCPIFRAGGHNGGKPARRPGASHGGLPWIGC